MVEGKDALPGHLRLWEDATGRTVGRDVGGNEFGTQHAGSAVLDLGMGIMTSPGLRVKQQGNSYRHHLHRHPRRRFSCTCTYSCRSRCRRRRRHRHSIQRRSQFVGGRPAHELNGSH